MNAKLAATVGHLNAAAESALEKLAAVEQELLVSNLAFPWYLTLPCGVDFGWDRVADRWQFTHIAKNGDPLPIKDATRVVRIQAASMANEFIDLYCDAVDKWLCEQEKKIE